MIQSAFLLLWLLPALSSALSCLDASGQPTDSWVALKHNDGRNYSVYDASSAAFVKDTYFGASNSPFDHTLLSLYAQQGVRTYALYDDETPWMHQSTSNAHMKGIIGIGDTTGFWLIHSIPRFPVTLATYNQSGYVYPDNETKYGQSLMCLTLDLATFETVGKALFIDFPQVYDSRMDPSHESIMPSLAGVFKGQHSSGSEAKTFDITTVGGINITMFAKTRSWGKELYGDFVAPTFNDGLYVESWLNGRGKLGTVCKPYAVYDVELIKLPDQDNWKETQDHSKWAVGVNKPWVCVGDINRQHGQMRRGGGTYCRNDLNLWHAFRTLIVGYNATCPM